MWILFLTTQYTYIFLQQSWNWQRNGWDAEKGYLLKKTTEQEKLPDAEIVDDSRTFSVILVPQTIQN